MSSEVFWRKEPNPSKGNECYLANMSSEVPREKGVATEIVLIMNKINEIRNSKRCHQYWYSARLNVRHGVLVPALA